MSKHLMASYGSCLNIGQMQQRCPTAQPFAKSWLFDHRLAFKGRPSGAHATVVPAIGQAVPVVVWEISDQDEAVLDAYHGTDQGYHKKQHVPLEVDGEIQDVLIYIMRACDYNLPSTQYLDIVTRGYVDFNLPTTSLDDALNYSYQGMITYQNHREETHYGN